MTGSGDFDVLHGARGTHEAAVRICTTPPTLLLYTAAAVVAAVLNMIRRQKGENEDGTTHKSTMSQERGCQRPNPLKI